MYRDMVTIQQDASTGDTAVPDYSSTFMESVPCRITARGGNEQYRGRMLEAHITHVVEMQYISGITPSMRLRVDAGVHKGTASDPNYLNIQYALPIEGNGRARKLELHCVENVGR